MKYNININQEKLSQIDGITFQDAGIIDWLYGMFGSDNVKIDNKRLNGYTWISLSYLIEDMPLLNIKSNSGASKLIKRIVNLGLIETKTDRKEQKLYAKPTKKMKDLYFGTKSHKTQHQVLEETTQVLADTNTYTSINTLNNTIIPPEVDTPFSLEEELVKLEESNWKPNKILALYFRFSNLKFQNKKQFTSEVAKNRKGAISLEGYNSSQIIAVMEYCEKNYKDFGWNLYTINKRISLFLSGKI